MNNNLKELYNDIIIRNEEDYKKLLNYYYELLKNNGFTRYYDLDKLMRENYDELNIFNFWFCIEKLFNGERDLSWVEHPLVFSLKNDLVCIEEELTHKARILHTDFRKYYNNSKYFITLKHTIKDILNNNKTGLTKQEISNNIDLDINSKDSDIIRALDDLIKNKEIHIIDNKKPNTYYIK